MNDWPKDWRPNQCTCPPLCKDRNVKTVVIIIMVVSFWQKIMYNSPRNQIIFFCFQLRLLFSLFDASWILLLSFSHPSSFPWRLSFNPFLYRRQKYSFFPDHESNVLSFVSLYIIYQTDYLWCSQEAISITITLSLDPGRWTGRYRLSVKGLNGWIDRSTIEAGQSEQCAPVVSGASSGCGLRNDLTPRKVSCE